MNPKSLLNLKLSEKDKKLIPYLGIILALMIFYFLVYLPTNNKITELEAELNTKTADLTAQEKEIKDMRTWQNKERHKKELTLATFLDDITILANQEKMSITSFSQGDISTQDKKENKEEGKGPQIAKNAGKLLPTLLNIKLEGDYFAVESFLKNYQQKINSVVLTSVQISRSEDSPKLQLTLTAKALF